MAAYSDPASKGPLRPGWFSPEDPRVPKTIRCAGTKARGLAYQRKVHQVLSRCFAPDALRAGDWLWTGAHWLQPDFVLTSMAPPFEGKTLLIEAKLTYTPAAWQQLERYRQALFRLRLARPDAVLRLQVCRNLIPGIPPGIIIEDLALAKDLTCWHLFL